MCLNEAAPSVEMQMWTDEEKQMSKRQKFSTSWTCGLKSIVLQGDIVEGKTQAACGQIGKD